MLVLCYVETIGGWMIRLAVSSATRRESPLLSPDGSRYKQFIAFQANRMFMSPSYFPISLPSINLG